ncbi:hypothetical protein [Suttonella ornithocola]|uniref:Cbb3-type cytochrome oxidase, subunit 3 n=1 Tax=Suttonella ornithocola TaxID=279832 RepID=A0A380MVT6_9GAMM|nr:hypothetical protein [Suttonella ornithocola]SUO96690.1 Uncharacterised protein [Suttonella ornithocola]
MDTITFFILFAIACVAGFIVSLFLRKEEYFVDNNDNLDNSSYNQYKKFDNPHTPSHTHNINSFWTD